MSGENESLHLLRQLSTELAAVRADLSTIRADLSSMQVTITRMEERHSSLDRLHSDTRVEMRDLQVKVQTLQDEHLRMTTTINLLKSGGGVLGVGGVVQLILFLLRTFGGA